MNNGYELPVPLFKDSSSIPQTHDWLESGGRLAICAFDVVVIPTFEVSSAMPKNAAAIAIC